MSSKRKRKRKNERDEHRRDFPYLKDVAKSIKKKDAHYIGSYPLKDLLTYPPQDTWLEKGIR